MKKLFNIFKKDYKFWLVFITLVLFGMAWLYFNKINFGKENKFDFGIREDPQYRIYLEKKSERDACLENARAVGRAAIQGAIEQNYDYEKFRKVLEERNGEIESCYGRFPL